MNLLADESIGKSIVNELRQNGHNVLYIAEFAPSIDDEAVLYQANLNRALLLTEDKDFGELVFRQGLVHMGVVLVRLSGLSLPAKATSISTVLANHEDELLEAFSVISPGRVRIRQGL
ncbi:hypothetical protein F4Z99_06925 [Candidatus Poribacteria bacterium]|nr:hypothetical protein [Candidatus Poribacteria bacterium]MYA98394.1 hypothetical protein [Candidatus Poribacteria bacterium]